jgi:hypothetical protein
VTATLSILGPDDVERERQELLRDVGATREQLDEREAAYDLGPHERDVLRRLRIRDFIGG